MFCEEDRSGIKCGQTLYENVLIRGQKTPLFQRIPIDYQKKFTFYSHLSFLDFQAAISLTKKKKYYIIDIPNLKKEDLIL